MVYEELKSLAGGWGRSGQPDGRSQREVSSPEIIGMGALSKLAATVITYPSQVCPNSLPHVGFNSLCSGRNVCG
jgi:hypothetical protein